MLKPFCLRRVKSEVEVNLPSRTETRVHCPLTPMQTFWYKRLLLRDSSLLLKLERTAADGSCGAEAAHTLAAEAKAKAEAADGDAYDGGGGGGGGNDWRRLCSLVMQLRKCCNHPYLFPGRPSTPLTHPQHTLNTSLIHP